MTIQTKSDGISTRSDRQRTGPFVKLMRRPELGAVAGTILIFLLFGLTAGHSGMFSARGIVSFLEVSAR